MEFQFFQTVIKMPLQHATSSLFNKDATLLRVPFVYVYVAVAAVGLHRFITGKFLLKTATESALIW